MCVGGGGVWTPVPPLDPRMFPHAQNHRRKIWKTIKAHIGSDKQFSSVLRILLNLNMCCGYSKEPSH